MRGFDPETDLGGALDEARGLASQFSRELAEANRELRTMDGEAQRLSRSLGSSLRGAFDKAVFGGRNLSDVLRGLVGDIAGKTLDAAVRPVQSAIGSGVEGLVGSLAGAIGSALTFGDGGVLSGGRVRAFARGGIVDRATLFPMRGGTGLMGEAGPEAILPLSRGADGRLGVAASGGGGAAPVIVNITTPDVAGFQRSRGQIAAQLARAVQSGSGRL